MKQLYRLTAEGRQRAKRMMFRKMVVMLAALEFLVLAVTVFLWRPSTGVLLGLVATAVVMLVGVSVLVWRSASMDWSNWGLYLDDEQVYLTEFPDSPRLRRSEVTRITESRAGVIVYGAALGHQLFIPAGVEDYPDIKKRLASWASRT